MRQHILQQLVKSLLALQNGNSPVENSLSDNNNTLRPERNKLSELTLKGLRRMKEEARSQGGSHAIDTNDKRTVKAMSESHKEYRKRLEEEKRLEAEEEARKKAKLEKEQIEQQKKQEAKSKSDLLDKKSEQLQKDREVTETEIQVARNLLTNAKKQMADAINAEDMIKIKAAQLLQNQATAQLENLLATQESQLKKSAKIEKKRKNTLKSLFAKKNKK